MRAWVIEQAGPAESAPLAGRDRPIVEPGPGEVRLAVVCCGVCRTDVHVAEGDLPLRAGPIVPGHQIVGVVEAIGPGVTSPTTGERVGVTWLASTCGACPACRANRENLCPDARFTGWDRDGGFADRAIARAAYCVPLPPTLPSEEAAPLLCAGAIGYRAFRATSAGPGARVGLVGFGASAHLTLQIARASGCEVVVFTRGETHRQEARAAGANWAGALDDGPGGRPAGCDAIVTFAPSGEVVPGALRHLLPGGTLAINAVHLSDLPAMPYALLYGERVVRSVANLTRRDARELVDLATTAPIRPRPTVYPFEAANEALLDVKRSRVSAQAVLRVGG